jgi:hypothetical protein
MTPPNTPDNLAGLAPGQTVSNITTQSIGVAFTQVVPNNPLRKTLLLVNVSGQNIYIGIDQNVSINQGILLVPQGGSFSTADWEDYDFTRHAFYAIASGAGSGLIVVEVQQST